jgi:hypothetical protein
VDALEVTVFERSFGMANPDRDVYSNDGTTNRTVYSRESSSTGWFVGIIVALALLAIGYLVFSANSGPATDTTTINNTPAVETPITDPATSPMTEAPPAAEPAPMTEAPATDAPPATDAAPATEAPPATDAAPATPAPAT